ncbi:MAG TPA: hypothetical protein VF290_11075 [Pyrinomonadaceae bacterium]
MSEERTSPHTEGDESGLLLSVEATSERSLDSAALSDDTDNVDATDTDAEDKVGDTDGTDAADTDATDDADGTD